MKSNRVKAAAVSLAAVSLAVVSLVMLSLFVLAATRPGVAHASQAAQQTPAATQAVVTETTKPAGGAFVMINASAGFPLDPFLTSVQGGGTVKASTLAADCTGFIAANPTVSVAFGGKADILRAFFFSDGDPTLVVRTPDGAFHCNDNTNQLILDPTVEITQPVTGRYDVWIGSKVATDLIPGFLGFTSSSDMDASRLDLRNLVKRAAAPPFVPVRDRLVNAARRVEQAIAAIKNVDALKAGGAAVTQVFTATGELPAVELQTGNTLCGGLVEIVPTYAFDWSGDATSLTLVAEAGSDTTLLVRTPGGSFLCADDSSGTGDAKGAGNLNPRLTIPEPSAGRYLVWVGRVDPGTPASGVLTLTEAADATPAVLEKP